MSVRSVQLVLHYDGGAFAGWQRQSTARTVQGEVEAALQRLCGEPTPVIGAGRTDAGVHARGQAAGVRLAERWAAPTIRRALNAVLPPDIWVAAAHEMRPDFHARYSASARRYSYYIGMDEGANSPFRRPYEWVFTRPLDRASLDIAARSLIGSHAFRAFAVRGTAPPGDDHRCSVHHAGWSDRAGGLVFEVEANRFLHHMVRFLVGTMVDIGAGRRDARAMTELLIADDNRGVSAPAPAHALFLDRVDYPVDLYLPSA
jgi:tRNA pseudouridine38-40 synthase